MPMAPGIEEEVGEKREGFPEMAGAVKVPLRSLCGLLFSTTHTFAASLSHRGI